MSYNGCMTKRRLQSFHTCTFRDLKQENDYTRIISALAFRMVIIVVSSVFCFTSVLIFKKFRNEVSFHFPESASIVYLAFLAKPIPANPETTPARILLVSACITGAMVFWSYNAVLTSYLTVEKINYPIRSLEVATLNRMIRSYEYRTLKGSHWAGF